MGAATKLEQWTMEGYVVGILKFQLQLQIYENFGLMKEQGQFDQVDPFRVLVIATSRVYDLERVIHQLVQKEQKLV